LVSRDAEYSERSADFTRAQNLTRRESEPARAPLRVAANPESPRPTSRTPSLPTPFPDLKTLAAELEFAGRNEDWHGA
jgi:hypothetical protein